MSYVEKFLHYFNDNRNFEPGAFIEFELKLIIDPRNAKNPPFIKFVDQDIFLKCKDLFTHFNSIVSPINKQTINFIESIDNVNYIKELAFDNAVQDKTKKRFYQKKRLHSPIYLCSNKEYNFKLSLSSEAKSGEINNFNLVRFRQRFTFIYKNWNIDFTFVKELQTQSIHDIKAIKEKLFTNVDADNIFTTNDWIWEYADSIEIEFEYNYASKYLTLDDINECLSVLWINDVTKTVETHHETNFIQRLFTIINPKKLGNSNANTLKKILPNAIEINKQQYIEDILPKINMFYITDKADGLRILLIINDDWISTFSSEFKVLEKNSFFKLRETIIECELIDGVFYAFDIIKYDGLSCVNKIFDARLKLMTNLMGIWNKLVIKNFVKLTKENYSTQIKITKNIKHIYEVDGIIFTSCNDFYVNTKFYKWKPMKNMTIDFVAKKCPVNLLGVSPYIVKPGRELYILFSGIKLDEFKKFNMTKMQYYNTMFPTHDGNYFPIQFSPSDSPNAYLFWHPISSDEITLDNKIIELRYSTEWELVRVRADRVSEFQTKNYFGNNFKVAELIWRNYSNPLTLRAMCSNIESLHKNSYFKVHNSVKHIAPRRFNNMVKFNLIDRLAANFTGNTWVVDLGCGKGQDLNKYIKMPTIKNVLFVDVSEANLCSIVERKYTYAYNKNITDTSLGIYMQQLDLNADAKLNYDIIRQNHTALQKIDTKMIVCNFAIHYFAKGDNLNNFLSLVDSMLPKGGRFLFTCLNGQDIYNLLKTDKDGVYKSWGDGDKYLIEPKFTNKIFVGGEDIDILLPFSSQTLYRESLVNLKLIEKKLKQKGITLESQSNFSDRYLGEFMETDPLSKTLDAIDLEYLKLVSFSIYYKK